MVSKTRPGLKQHEHLVLTKNMSRYSNLYSTQILPKPQGQRNKLKNSCPLTRLLLITISSLIGF